jgi:AcrR family transcriptional regulator
MNARSMRDPHKMSTDVSMAKEPKRERGKQRVAALLDGAAAAFRELGYEATTMTEIAARAGASIGSLYQFFPSKEAVAEALFRRYADAVSRGLALLAECAPGSTPEQLADLFIGQELRLRADRAVAAALIDMVASIGDRGKPLRSALRQQVAMVFQAARPGLRAPRARMAAAMTLYALKLVPRVAEEEEQTQLPLVNELRRWLALYLSDVLGPSAAATRRVHRPVARRASRPRKSHT